MASCEKCWRDAHRAPDASVADEYARLLKQRDRTNPCTPEEQAGEHATSCGGCGRRTVHQHARVCMACDWREGGGA